MPSASGFRLARCLEVPPAKLSADGGTSSGYDFVSPADWAKCGSNCANSK